jgi:hypothetical protein
MGTNREENENIQFIIVTSSTALIEKATSEELFMLMPSQQLDEGSNQLANPHVAGMFLTHLCSIRSITPEFKNWSKVEIFSHFQKCVMNANNVVFHNLYEEGTSIGGSPL